MELLASAQRACDRLGIARVASLASPIDQTARTLIGFANQEAEDLARRHRWTALTRERVFTSVASEAQPGIIPEDFETLCEGSFWNRSLRRRVEGPLTPSEWQQMKAAGAVVLPDRYIIRAGVLNLSPTPPAGATYAFEYVSNWPVVSVAGVTKRYFTADDDQLLMAPHVLTLGLVWRYRQARGFDYAEEFRAYETAVMEAMQKDGGKRRVFMGEPASSTSSALLVQEGNWTLQ